jgi:ppGpp synthetase/RelA/SpoT-type nucleotidyltranferase
MSTSEPSFPLPCSKSQVRRIGSALATGTQTDDDEEMFGRVLDVYDRLKSHVWRQLERHDWSGLVADPNVRIQTTGRLKSRETLLDKLRRPGANLHSVRDVAGVRVVGDFTLLGQDKLAAEVARLFDAQRIIDRRENPVMGYRAVHVELSVDRLPAEVQIRTHRQQDWANLYEALADRWGREMRYRTPEWPAGSDRRSIYDIMQLLSTAIAGIEQAEDSFPRLSEGGERLRMRSLIDGQQSALDEAFDRIADLAPRADA